MGVLRGKKQLVSTGSEESLTGDNSALTGAGGITSVQVIDADNSSLLLMVLTELKIMNIHLSSISDEEITYGEVE